MNWHDFVFSQKRQIRLLRHLSFWFAWWIYFSTCDLLYQIPIKAVNVSPMYVTTGEHILIKSVLLILVYAISGYTFINSVLPEIIKGRWINATGKIMLLGLLLFISGYLIFWYAFPLIDSLFEPYKPNTFVTKFWPAVYLGIINPTKVLATAGFIKYIKYWWVQQKETEGLEREIIDTELQLLKNQVNPGFLFTSLDSIYKYSSAFSSMASSMLLKLSDLLSYMLYECNQPLVYLQKDVEIMKHYISLEKIRIGESFDVEFNIIGEIGSKKIAPLLMLPIIENGIETISKEGNQHWVNMDIFVDGDVFTITVTNGINDTNGKSESISASIKNLQKRLHLLYPEKHQLKMIAEHEMQIVQLKIRLGDLDILEPVLTNDQYYETIHESN